MIVGCTYVCGGEYVIGENIRAGGSVSVMVSVTTGASAIMGCSMMVSVTTGAAMFSMIVGCTYVCGGEYVIGENTGAAGNVSVMVSVTTGASVIMGCSVMLSV